LADEVGRGHSRRHFARKNSSPQPIAHIFDRPVFWPPRQVLTGHARNVAISLAMAAMVASGVACRSERGADTADSADLKVRTTSRGGDLRVSLRSDPQSFNWITRRDSSAYLVTLLTQALPFRRFLAWLGVAGQAEPREVDESRAVLIGARRAQLELDQLLASGLVSRQEHAERRAAFQRAIIEAERALRVAGVHSHEDVVVPAVLSAQKAAILDAARRGLITGLDLRE